MSAANATMHAVHIIDKNELAQAIEVCADQARAVLANGRPALGNKSPLVGLYINGSELRAELKKVTLVDNTVLCNLKVTDLKSADTATYSVGLILTHRGWDGSASVLPAGMDD